MVANFLEYHSLPYEQIYTFGLSKSEVLRQAMNDTVCSAMTYVPNQHKTHVIAGLNQSENLHHHLQNMNDYQYINRHTQHKHSYVQMYDHCGRPVHIGRETLTNRDEHSRSLLVPKNNKSTSTDTRAKFLTEFNQVAHPIKAIKREKFETYITLSNEPITKGVKKVLYLASTPSEVAVARRKPTSITNATPSIKLYVQSNIEESPKEKFTSSDGGNNKQGASENGKLTSQRRLTVQTTSIDNISIEQISHPHLKTNISVCSNTSSRDSRRNRTKRTNADRAKPNANTNNATSVSVKRNKNNLNQDQERSSDDSSAQTKTTTCQQIKIASCATPDTISLISIGNGSNNKQVIKVIETIPPSLRSSRGKSIPEAPPLPASLTPGGENGNAMYATGNSNDANSALDSESSFPWEKLDCEKIKGTVWEKCRASLSDENLIDIIENNIDNVGNTGSCERRGPPWNSPMAGKTTKDKSRGAFYLHYKKAYNLAIILGGLKKPVAAVVRGLREMDESTITPEVVTHLLQYGPDEEEAKQLLSVSDPDVLEKPDFLAYELLRLPMYVERLKAMLLRTTLDERIEDIRRSLNIISEACRTLKASKNVKDLIELVLILGNYLNKDSARYGKAHGFKVDVLSKLENMRIKSKQVSVMNLLLRLTKKQFNRDPNMQQEIRIISAASAIDLNHIDEEIRKLSSCVEAVEVTAENIRQYEQVDASKDMFMAKIADFLVDAGEKMIKLKQDNCKVRELFADLRKYFGDDNKETTSERFFSTFKCFLSRFQV